MLTRSNIFIITIIVIVLSGVLSLYFFWNPVEHVFFPKCPIYSLTGIYCAGCGSQRAIHQIANGNIITGIRHNYLLLIVFFILGYKTVLFVLNKLYKKSYWDIFHKPMATKIVLVIVLLFWLFRNIKVFPFTELAP